jgi:hypothetical protein
LGDVVVTGSYDDSSFAPQVVTIVGGNTRIIPARGFVAGVFPTNIV